MTLKGNSGQNFFSKKLHSSYRALKCQENPFCFIILINFFVIVTVIVTVIAALANFQKTHLILAVTQHKFYFKA